MYFFKRTAVIIETNLATNKVEVSDELPSVQMANHASHGIIAAEGGIKVSVETNEFDGLETTFIAKSAKPGIWHEKEHIVLPSAEISE